MNFEDIKKIWDEQNNKALYAIDQESLHRRVIQKQKQGLHITTWSEILLIVVNIISAVSLFLVVSEKEKQNISLFILACWMLMCGGYFLFNRVRRIKSDTRFDRTITDDLNYAIALAAYQVRLAFIGRWNIVPVSILTLVAIVEAGKSPWLLIFVFAFFVITFFLSGWESNLYHRRLNELNSLKRKLDDFGVTP